MSTFENNSVPEAAAHVPVTESIPDESCGHLKGGDVTRQSSGKLWSKQPTSLKFFSGNPNVETTEGVVHLYREE